MEISIKKNLVASSIAGVFIGVLSIPVIHNLTGSNNALIFIGLIILCFVGSVFATWVGYIIGKKIKVIFEVIKFGITGVLNTFVDFGVLNLLMFIFSAISGIWYAIFKSVSFLVAVINSYFWNKYWTFGSKNKTNTTEATSFFVVSVIGFVINVATASLVVNMVPAIINVSGMVWANIGALVGTMSAFIWNFFGYKFFVFKNK